MNSPKAPWAISVKTNRGVFSLFMTQSGLYEVRFPGQSKIGRIGHSRVSGNPGLGSPMEAFGDDRIKRAVCEFTAYFKDPRTTLKIKLDLSSCTPFEKKVYRTLRRVPAGKVLSYGELAKRAGYPGAARAVGSAMKKNRLPVVIPCHRVIPSEVGLGDYSAGKKWKRWLLEHEER